MVSPFGEKGTFMLNTTHLSQRKIGDKDIILKTGTLAKQAGGSVLLQCGDAVLLATATAAKQPKPDASFFPLTVEYAEKMYASGKIPGGFFKREARPRTQATLTSRLIDRPIRPCFPEYYFNDVQVIVTVLSYDQRFSPDFLGITAASAALTISDIPFNGPVAGALIALVDGQYVFNPSNEQLDRSQLDIVVAGTRDAILMVEAGASEVSEAQVIEAIRFGHEYIKDLIVLQENLATQFSKSKQSVPAKVTDPLIEAEIKLIIGDRIAENMKSGKKNEIEDFLTQLEDDVLSKLVTTDPDNKAVVKTLFEEIKQEQIRNTIIKSKVRPDGRATTDIRPIEIEIGLLPSAHGSALFTRGETQSLGVVTLGTSDDEQIEDGLRRMPNSSYFFHYNFPPYSVGEVGNFNRTSRRELGHGALAERALKSVLPGREKFPYTIRIVSEILESNGSSSMASVCSGTLSLMDCGVPIKAPVSGIAMGLLLDDNDFTILSDIQGLEDHYGDMDFKVAGTSNGITALQLDIKVAGLSFEILTKALEQAKQGRLHILEQMTKVLHQPRVVLSKNAPQILTINVDPEKIGTIIGPGGKMIRKIEEVSQATVSISDDRPGEVVIAAQNADDLEKARKMIHDLVRTLEVGDEFEGKVVRITNFGAFVELLPGKDGLLHISKLSKSRVNKVEDILNVGDILNVKVSEIDPQKRVNLTLITQFE